jgi:hypothetical protein
MLARRLQEAVDALAYVPWPALAGLDRVLERANAGDLESHALANLRPLVQVDRAAIALPVPSRSPGCSVSLSDAYATSWCARKLRGAEVLPSNHTSPSTVIRQSRLASSISSAVTMHGPSTVAQSFILAGPRNSASKRYGSRALQSIRMV